MVFVGNAKWQCLECGYEAKRNHVRDHVEAKHLPPGEGYVCPHCNQHCKNNWSLKNHLKTHKYQ